MQFSVQGEKLSSASTMRTCAMESLTAMTGKTYMQQCKHKTVFCVHFWPLKMKFVPSAQHRYNRFSCKKFEKALMNIRPLGSKTAQLPFFSAWLLNYYY